jgi:hypothetical protein
LKGLAAAVGVFVGMALVIGVLLGVGLHRLNQINSHAAKRSSVNVEVICAAINQGRVYARAHIAHYALAPLPCHELVLKTIQASK